MLDPDDAVLLQRFSNGERSWWICPGGGLEQDEDVFAGAARELREELGLEGVELGAEIWRRRHVFEWRDQVLDQHERFFVLRVPERFEPCPAIGGDELFAEGVYEHRWWTVDEIDQGETPVTVFAPRQLGRLLRALLAEGEPAEPFDVGV